MRTRIRSLSDTQCFLPYAARGLEVCSYYTEGMMHDQMSGLGAAVLGAIDYKRTFAGRYRSEEMRLQAYSECHTRSARRVLRALLANGG